VETLPPTRLQRPPTRGAQVLCAFARMELEWPISSDRALLKGDGFVRAVIEGLETSVRAEAVACVSLLLA
jgi:hypothetical protein